MADITVTFTVPDGTESMYIDAVARAKGWTETVFDPETRAQIPNPVERLPYIKQCIGKDLIGAVQAVQIKAASDAAATKAKAESDARLAAIEIS